MFGRTTDRNSTMEGKVMKYHIIIIMGKSTHLIFYDRLQDRKAIKKITVKYLILFLLNYLHSFKPYYIQTQQRNSEVEMYSNH